MFTISESMLQCAPRPMLAIDRNWKSSPELAPNCPRCASANTKFCYYNNYSLSQPRYFCKGCRRYWTKGGSLRNVPVGGGCRKSRRGKFNRVDKNGAQVSTNYSKNLTSFGTHQEHMMGATTSHGDTGNQPGPATSTGSDIDLAVIFAQFLNQSTSSDQSEIILTQEWPNEGMDPWSCLEQDTNSQNDSSMELPVVHTIPESYNMLQEMPQVEQHLKDNSVEELLESDEINAFGLQNLLADEMVQDVFWSNYAANSPSFECQLQQLESFPADDQLKISANLMAETWTSFDFSGSELFSKP